MFFRERRKIMGYTDMGKVRVPPLPQYTIMTDRADGKLWLLSWNTTTPSFDSNGYISISDQIPNTPDKMIYGPYEGPYVQERLNTQGSPVLKLLIRSGRLGYEQIEVQGLASVDNSSVLTRRGMALSLREIVVPLVWKQHANTLGWRIVDFP